MLDRLRGSEDGFSLVETVVAMMIFTVFASVTARYLISTFSVTETNTQRVVAANLAGQAVETARNTRGVDLPDVPTVTTQTVTGTTYTITTTSSYGTTGSGSSVCDGSGASLAFKAVKVLVTWPGMGSVKPVRSDTVKTLGIGSDGLDATKGVAAVFVSGAAGQTPAGVTVRLDPGGQTKQTGADGCALFLGLDPAGIYTAGVSAGSAGSLVGIDGGRAVSTSAFGVEAGRVTRPVLNLDQPGTLRASVTAPSGYTVPATIPMSLNNSLFTPSNDRIFPDCADVPTTSPQGCVSGVPRSATSLYPGSYAAWPGRCADAKPTSPARQVVAAAAPAVLTAPALGGLTATFGPSYLSYIGSGTVYAVHLPDGSCASGEAYTLPLTGTSSSKTGKVALPTGTWYLATNTTASNPPSGGWPIVAVASGQSVTRDYP